MATRQGTWPSAYNQDREGLLLLSDAAHLPSLFVRNPEWSPAFDMDQQMARETPRQGG